MSQLEWFPVRAAETLSHQDLQGLSLEAKGLFWTLRLYCWKDGSVPTCPKRLARICQASEDVVESALEELIHLMDADPDDPSRLIMPMVEEARQEQADKHAKRSNAGAQRGKSNAEQSSAKLSNAEQSSAKLSNAEQSSAKLSNAEHFSTIEENRIDKRREEPPPNPPPEEGGYSLATRDGPWSPPPDAIPELEELAGGPERLRERLAEIRGSPGKPPKKRGALRWLKNRLTEAGGVQIPDALRAAIPTIDELWAERVANAKANGYRISIDVQNSQLEDATRWLPEVGTEAVAEAIGEAKRGGYAGLFKPKASRPRGGARRPDPSPPRSPRHEELLAARARLIAEGHDEDSEAVMEIEAEIVREASK